jgi:predicted transcriptional regulator
MKDRAHLLISLENRHAANILLGLKSVELRRRTMHVNDGDVVWFYVKKPIAAVIGYAIVGSRFTGSPQSIWRQFGGVSGLAKTEFTNYFKGAEVAFALEVKSPKTLKRAVSLTRLRETQPSFHPPQFYCRLAAGSALRSLFIRRSKA